MKACDVHILRPPSYFQQLQEAYALPDMIGTDPACFAGEVNLLEPLMPEAADHALSVNGLVYGVKRRPRAQPLCSEFHTIMAVRAIITTLVVPVIALAQMPFFPSCHAFDSAAFTAYGRGSCDDSKRETCMTITLRPEHEKAIAQAIQSGAYRDPDEVIGRALEVLRGEDEWLHEQ